MGPYARFWNRETHIPCQNPPFGEMIAVDLASGDIAWRSPLGTIEALEAIGVRDTGTAEPGRQHRDGGRPGVHRGDERFRDSGHSIRRRESCSGKRSWRRAAHTSPITYMGRDGRQYVALMAAGGGAFLGGPVSNTPGRVCAAGCSPEAVAGFGFEGGGRGRRSQARTANCRRVCARGAAGGRREGVGARKPAGRAVIPWRW